MPDHSQIADVVTGEPIGAGLAGTVALFGPIPYTAPDDRTGVRNTNARSPFFAGFDQILNGAYSV